MARTTVCSQCEQMRRIVLLTSTRPHEPRSDSPDGQVKRAQMQCGHSKLIVVPSLPKADWVDVRMESSSLDVRTVPEDVELDALYEAELANLASTPDEVGQEP